MNKNMALNFLSVVVLISFISGCAANQFARFYHDYTANIPPAQISKVLMPYSGRTQVFSTNDMKKDSDELARRGYVLLGESSFQGAVRVTPKMLQNQAQDVGADIVLYYSQYQGSEQTAMPFLQYNPGQSSTTYSSGTVNANAYGSGGYAHGTGSYSGTSSTSSPGTYSTSMVPVTVHHYIHDATFWRKRTTPIFGVFVTNLPDDIRTALKRNTGALVKTVMDDSPAFRANILPGDIITDISGITIYSGQDLLEKMPQFSGKKCDVLILRDGHQINVPVQMNTVPGN